MYLRFLDDDDNEKGVLGFVEGAVYARGGSAVTATMLRVYGPDGQQVTSADGDLWLRMIPQCFRTPWLRVTYEDGDVPVADEG
jgi:hypothetical protein